MRFLILLKGDIPDGEAWRRPDTAVAAAMARYEEDMVRAGVLLEEEGLHPSASGVRIRVSRRGRTVVAGPFPGAQDQIAGFYLIEVASREEAIAWAARCPVDAGFRDGEETEIEVRQVFDAP